MAEVTIVDENAVTPYERRVNSLADLACSDFAVQPSGSNNQNPFEPNVSTPDTFITSADYGTFTLNRWGLTYGYKSFGVIQTVVSQPVDDAFRGGIDIDIPELDDEDLALLHEAMEEGDDIMQAKLVGYWDRLFGGAGLITVTDQDPSTPLDLRKLHNQRLKFMAADRWELILSGLMTSGPGYDEMGVNPLELARDQYGYQSLGRYNYYGVPVDDSRVVKVSGHEAPSLIRPRLQGWGLSVLEQCMRSINTYILFGNLLFQLVGEAKVDVYKIEQFNEQLATAQGTSAIKLRIALANWLKNYRNAIAMDKEDEYEQKQLSFAGLSDIMVEFRINLCADLKIPYNKLFGQSATGFSSGEDSMENYNSMIDVEVRDKMRKPLRRIISLRCIQLFGYVPKFTFKFKPLRVLDGQEEEAVKTSKQNRIMQLRASDQITGQEADEILHKEGLLHIDTEVGAGLREPEPGGDAAAAVAGAQPDDEAAKAKEKKENAKRDAKLIQLEEYIVLAERRRRERAA